MTRNLGEIINDLFILINLEIEEEISQRKISKK